MTAHTSAFAEQNFEQWCNELLECDDFEQDDAEQLVKHLRDTREVMIVRTRDYLPPEDDGEDYCEYAIMPKTYPGLGLEESDDLDVLVDFCNEVGLKMVMHIYPDPLLASQKLN